MNRKSTFAIGLLTAILTFGTLMATIGPRDYHHHRGHCIERHHCNMDNQKGSSCHTDKHDKEDRDSLHF